MVQRECEKPYFRSFSNEPKSLIDIYRIVSITSHLHLRLHSLNRRFAKAQRFPLRPSVIPTQRRSPNRTALRPQRRAAARRRRRADAHTQERPSDRHTCMRTDHRLLPARQHKSPSSATMLLGQRSQPSVVHMHAQHIAGKLHTN